MSLVARFLIALFAAASFGCSLDGPTASSSDLTVWCECPSPDGKLIATFYTISGGGAAGSVYDSASVRATDQPLDVNGPALTMSRGRGARLSWVDDRHLRIEFPSGADVHRQEPVITTALGPVAIDFVTYPRDDPRLAGDPSCGPTSPVVAQTVGVAQGGPN
jgi:hypothetical protein